jgi:ubiquinone/menaquinone biosynthesis C-methylase UbiE
MFVKKSDDYKEQSRKKYDKDAQNYDSGDRGHHARELYSVVLNKLEDFRFNRILDVGCGTGNLLSYISSENEVDIAGVDISPNMLEIARNKLGEVADLREGDSENLPFEDESFNMVICNDSFHHYPKPEKVLTEIRRVLEPGGNILISDPYGAFLVRLILNFKLYFNKEGDVKIYSKGELCKFLENTGYEAIECNIIPDKNAILVTASK